MNRSIPWTRLVAEGVVIVASILLAFSLEAWWDRSQNIAEEREVLLGLEQEFSTYQVWFERSAARAERSTRLLEGVLFAGPPEFRDPPPAAEADSAIFAMLFNPTTNSDGGTLAALLSSGGLELIRNRDLRARLAAWPGVIADIRDNQLFRRDFEMNVLTPFLVSKGVPLSRAETTRYEWPMPLISDREAEQVYAELFRDPSFAAVAAESYATMVNAAGEYAAAVRTLEALLAFIRREIGSSGDG